MGDLSKNFSSSEFFSPDVERQEMQPVVINALQVARDLSEIPFKVNSGWRTLAHHVGLYRYTYRAGTVLEDYPGVPNSAHLRGWAADIAARNSRTRYIVVKAALKAGLHRVIIYPTFVHLDCDPSLPPDVIALGKMP